MTEAAAPSAAHEERAPWSTPRLIGFRFFACYWALYLLPMATSFLPFFNDTGDTFFRLWLPLVQWVGEHVLHLSYKITVLPAGSGDTTFDYVILLCYAAIAAGATVVWSIVDRRRREYERLEGGLRVVLRYSLGVIMLSYGGIKLIPTQFGRITADRLIQPYGESSPMGLLWTFMAFSPVYTAFCGLGESLGGILVLFRRTTALGALVCIGVLSNVVLLNFSYDVPVKLFSTHLLAMAVWLVLPDARRLADLLLFNRPVEAAPIRPLGFQARLRWPRAIAKTLFVAWAVVYPMYQAWQSLTQFNAPPAYAFAGTYEVESFMRNGMSVPTSDDRRWKHVILRTRFGARSMRDSVRIFTMERDTVKRLLTLKLWPPMAAGGDTLATQVLAYDRPDTNRLRLRGRFLGDSLDVEMRRIDRAKFLLMSRGFHWINEIPFNR